MIVYESARIKYDAMPPIGNGLALIPPHPLHEPIGTYSYNRIVWGMQKFLPCLKYPKNQSDLSCVCDWNANGIIGLIQHKIDIHLSIWYIALIEWSHGLSSNM